MERHIVAYECEIHTDVYQSETLEFPHYIAKLHRVLLQEFAAGGDVEKQIFHHQIASLHTRFRLLAFHLGAVDYKTCAYGRILVHGAKVNLRNSCNGSQCLTSESHGVKGEEIIGMLYLGCGVTLESEASVSVAHSHAVVYYLNQCPSGIFKHYGDRCGSGIDGIFHQLLYDRCGALYHFAGSDLISHRVRKEFYDVTHFSVFSLFSGSVTGVEEGIGGVAGMSGASCGSSGLSEVSGRSAPCAAF